MKVNVAALALAWAVTSSSADARAEVRVLRESGVVEDLARVGLSLAARPPSGPSSPESSEARLLLEGAEAQAREIELVSFARDGHELDRVQVALALHPCPSNAPGECVVTPGLRLVGDRTDRDHPLARGRSILSELGGTVVVRVAGRELARANVGPLPLASSSGEVLSARLRVILVRAFPGGGTALGKERSRAIASMRRTITAASKLWSPCGIRLDAEAEISVVDPPPSALVSFGCGQALPASGGELRLAVDGREFRVPIPRGATPRGAARRLRDVLEGAGFAVELSDNPRAGYAAMASADLVVRGANGALAVVTPMVASADGAVAPLSTDPTLDICIGSVDLSDGLQHFGDVDAAVGTLEERTLVRSLADKDSRTVDVLVVPGFARGGRIGESFIGADRGSLGHVVLLDRAALQPARASLTLAHELGHVLLDDPGHPDDFGADTPTALMDADASDVSAFGPRRLSARECLRARTQSGPRASVPLLTGPPPIAK